MDVRSNFSRVGQSPKFAYSLQVPDDANARWQNPLPFLPKKRFTIYISILLYFTIYFVDKTLYHLFCAAWTSILNLLSEMLFSTLRLSEMFFFHKLPNIHFSSAFYK